MAAGPDTDTGRFSFAVIVSPLVTDNATAE